MVLIYIPILLVSLASLWLWGSKKKSKEIATRSKRITNFGSLLKLGPNPHRDLHKLSQKYGPIMHLRLGLVPIIVVSSPQAAELFLKTHDLVFASRPPIEAAKNHRLGSEELEFCHAKINSFKTMREQELDLLIKFLREKTNDRTKVDLSTKVSTLTADMSCRMVLGKKYTDDDLDEKGFKAVMLETMHLSATPNIEKSLMIFFDKIIDEHIQSDNKDDKTKDFVDVMLGFVGTEESEYRIERNDIKAIMLDMLGGSMDTSATAIEWAISELLKNPRVMKNVQKELETVVGMKRKVEESDLDKLKYLEMVIKESLRLHPVAPLLIPYQSLEDCMVEDLFIPKKSRVIVNAWSIMRDPNAWTDPEKFWPERFEGNNIDVKGRDFQLIPFGSGRRGCPGLQLGLTVIRLVVAQLVHCFDWKLPNHMLPSDLDMTEDFGLTMPRANNLIAIPAYRLCRDNN
ncbi:cytochrome P450 family 71 protein [Medicago truncatula]|uniref:Cytochrome P450 family 71 protein n=1 Tax=Medicago truncatula TaxID=3880 RepID=G7LB93_MEDTR|nr:cytochrome P450 family 71 protein [Medicago truncatula]